MIVERYYHNLVKNMNHYPLIKFRLCNNGMRSVSCKVLTDKAHKHSGTSCEIALRWMQKIWWYVGLDNGLVLPGNKPSPEPMFTQIDVTLWHQ